MADQKWIVMTSLRSDFQKLIKKLFNKYKIITINVGDYSRNRRVIWDLLPVNINSEDIDYTHIFTTHIFATRYIFNTGHNVIINYYKSIPINNSLNLINFEILI